MTRGHIIPIVIGIAVACGATGALARQYGSPDAKEATKTAAPQGAQNGAPDGPPKGDMGDILVKGLKETPGCLGVESGGMASGKQVIFAFFKDKAAAMAWYNSPTHTRFRTMFPVTDPNHVAMKHVPDNVPIMALASISFQGEPAIKDSKIPFSHISIELYTPLSAGLSINGGFAPEAFRNLVKEPE
jgi:hypothetical protein